jgi:hypothetical protein
MRSAVDAGLHHASQPGARRRRSGAAAAGPSCGSGRCATRRGGPRAAAQHLVARAEEDLGVLAVRVGAEARVAAEVARRPLPDVAEHAQRAARAAPSGWRHRLGAEGALIEVGVARRTAGGGPRPLVPGRRLLPLELVGAGAVRAGEGVGLEPGNVGRRACPGRAATHWPIRHSCRRPTSAGVRDVVLLLPRPRLVRPQRAALVAAALGEVAPGGVRDRRAADAEGRQRDHVPGRSLS